MVADAADKLRITIGAIPTEQEKKVERSKREREVQGRGTDESDSVDEFGSPEVLRLEEVPTPQPGPGQVLVRMHAIPLPTQPAAVAQVAMSTASEIEEAIRTLPASEREKLLRHIPALFPELAVDAEWERIIQDERPRPELSRLLDETDEQLRRDPNSFSRMKPSDFTE